MENPNIKKKKTRIALVVATFHTSVVEVMKAAATITIDEMNGRLASCAEVPGAYEIPLAAQHALRNPLIDAVVVLGYIEKGETLHGEVMGYVVHNALMRLQLDHDKPIGFGIIGPGATNAQARKRAADTARRAVEAVCHMNALASESQ